MAPVCQTRPNDCQGDETNRRQSDRVREPDRTVASRQRSQRPLNEYRSERPPTSSLRGRACSRPNRAFRVSRRCAAVSQSTTPTRLSNRFASQPRGGEPDPKRREQRLRHSHQRGGPPKSHRSRGEQRSDRPYPNLVRLPLPHRSADTNRRRRSSRHEGQLVGGRSHRPEATRNNPHDHEDPKLSQQLTADRPTDLRRLSHQCRVGRRLSSRKSTPPTRVRPARNRPSAVTIQPCGPWRGQRS